MLYPVFSPIVLFFYCCMNIILNCITGIYKKYCKFYAVKHSFSTLIANFASL